MERNANRTRIDGFAYPTFPKLRGPTPKNVGNWLNLTAPAKELICSTKLKTQGDHAGTCTILSSAEGRCSA